MRNSRLLFLCLTVVFGACADASNTNTAANTSPYQSESQSLPTEKMSSKDRLSGNSSGGGGGGGRMNEQVSQQVTLNQVENSQTQPTVIDRKIVRNADLQLESDSPEQAQQKITAIIESKGGFVVESQQSGSDLRATTRDIVTMTLRIPSDKFGESLGEIRKTASRVVVETVKADDVTEEFIDVEAQLKAKKALEAQFLEIMKRANTVEDALNVQRELADVRGEIEKVEGRKRFLENQSSFSTIKIRLQTPTVFTANSEGFFYRLGQAFGKGFDAALSFILALVSFVIAILPFLIFIVLPVYLIVRYFLKKHRNRLKAAEIAETELKED